MKTITTLRNELSEIFMKLKNGELDPKTAGEMNNAAGKMINTAKVQMEYALLRKETPRIEFLEGK